MSGRNLLIDYYLLFRPTDYKFGGLASEARELLRRRLIGKQVHISVDYIRPKEGDYEAKECVTMKLPTGVYGWSSLHSSSL